MDACITGGVDVNTRMHVYWGGSELWGVFMHDRNMEDVNTRMHVYWGGSEL